jgi:hypothetical protein
LRAEGGSAVLQDHWLPGFNFNVEEWDEKGLHYETLAICRALTRAVPFFDDRHDLKGTPRFTKMLRT